MEEDYLIAQTLYRQAEELEVTHNKTKRAAEQLLLRIAIRRLIDGANKLLGR